MSKEVVIEDLAVVQAGLFPAWHDVSKRHNRVLYLKSKLEEESRYATASADPILGDSLPADAATHSSQLVSALADVTNYCQGFRNLGNACYFNSVLQCFFSCHAARTDLQEHVADGGRIRAQFLSVCQKYVVGITKS